ncbi:MAG: pyridoxamine 5'-phosphate oxidase family protein [Ilumatobacter sp.]
MTEPAPGTEILSEEACWERLRRTTVGRLGVHHDDRPAIYPVNYLVDGHSIVFRTRTESKISAAPHLERVAFEIDGFEPSQGDAWSVLIKGFGRFVESHREIKHADQLPLYPWVDVDRSAWIRIVPVEVTGRRFHLLDTAVTDSSVGWTDAND